MFFQKRFLSLQQLTKDPIDGHNLTNIQNLIGLVNIPQGKYTINATNCDNYCSVIIHYTHNNNHFILFTNKIKMFPPEINRLISEYTQCTITLQINIHSTNGYPFNAPKWSLVSCDDRLASSLINAKEYYEYIVQNHNNSNDLDWSPATNIDSDILTFILRINHFDSLYF